MLVIAKVSLNVFADTLAESIRLDERVGVSCCTVEELHSQVSEYYDSVKLPPHLKNTPANRGVGFIGFFDTVCKVRVVFDGTEAVGGYIVLGGELIALHCRIKGKGQWLLNNAIGDGAERLNCFDYPQLRKIYTEAGFTVDRTEANWHKNGAPILYMSRK